MVFQLYHNYIQNNDDEVDDENDLKLLYFFRCSYINLLNFLADFSAALSFRPTMAPQGGSHSFLYAL